KRFHHAIARIFFSFLYPYRDHRILHSFPTRRSSDLVSAVSYDSHDPLDKALKSFAVNLTDNPGFGQLLQQARGEKVEVVLQQAPDRKSTRLNSSHSQISYAVFCLKKKT